MVDNMLVPALSRVFSKIFLAFLKYSWLSSWESGEPAKLQKVSEILKTCLS